MATLFLTCGLPASGKTTVAKTLEREHAAVRLTADEWLRRIHPDLSGAQLDQLRPGVEHLQEELAGRLLSLGVNVILDWGLWAREERDHFRALARRLGAKVVLLRSEREHAAVRLTADEWLRRIHPDLSGAQLDQLRPGVEHLQEELAGRLLSLGVNVILDWGLWAREERDHFRALARRLGAKVVLL